MCAQAGFTGGGGGVMVFDENCGQGGGGGGLEQGVTNTLPFKCHLPITVTLRGGFEDTGVTNGGLGIRYPAYGVPAKDPGTTLTPFPELNTPFLKQWGPPLCLL